MYIEPLPVSVFLHQAMVAVESPRPLLRRPPEILNQPSSSSLRGMEMTAPSFQAFIKKTPPVGQEKPLPPVPRSEALVRPFLKSRRTSSVYSRTVSQWAPTPESWKSRDLAASGIFLQPSIYSISTPELVVDDSKTEQIVTTLLPRAYQPLISTPSPSPSPSLANTSLTELSVASTEEHVQGRRPSTLLPPPWRPAGHSIFTSPNQVRTVSLSTARAAQHAPGARYLFPEEMRALAAEKARKGALHKSRSFEMIGAMNIAPVSPLLPSSPADYGYWPVGKVDRSPIRIIAQPHQWAQPPVVKFKLRDSKLSDKYFGMDPIIRAAVAPIATQQPRNSITTLEMHSSRKESSEEEHDYENRGRLRSPLTASLSSPDYDHYNGLSSGTDVDNASVISEADRLAKEYHDLLPAQDFQSPKKKSSFDGRDIKLAPQPLFFNPRQVSKQRIEQYNRTRNGSMLAYDSSGRRSERAGPPSRRRNDSPPSTFPMKLSLTPDSTRSHSTSGSIPISPPVNPMHKTESQQPPARKKPSLFSNILSSSSVKPYRLSIDDSAQTPPFYTDQYAIQHKTLDKSDATSSPPFLSPVGATVIATKAEAKTVFDVKSTSSLSFPSPGATVVATRAEAETAFAPRSPIDAEAFRNHKSKHKHKTSDSSGTSSHRAAKNPLTHMGGKMASLGNAIHRSSHWTPTMASLHFGRSASPGDGPRTPKLSISPPMIQTISKPLPILDDNKGVLRETSSLAAQKRPSLFAHVVDMRRESKAIKRREELKKSIRLVPESVAEGQVSQSGRQGGAHDWL